MVAAGVGIAPTLPVLQTGVQTHYTIQRFQKWSFRAVTLQRSFGYRPKALLLSYRRCHVPWALIARLKTLRIALRFTFLPLLLERAGDLSRLGTSKGIRSSEGREAASGRERVTGGLLLGHSYCYTPKGNFQRDLKDLWVGRLGRKVIVLIGCLILMMRLGL